MSIWRNFVLLFLPLTILVPILVVAGVSRQQEQLRTVVSERDEQTARTAAAAMTEQLNSRAELVHGVAEQAAVSNDLELLLSSIGFLEAQFEGGFAVFSLTGDLLAVRGAEPTDVVAWPSPATPLSPFSAAFMDARSGNLMMLVTATNEVVQVVGAFFPTDLANEVLRSVLDNDRPIEAYIIDENGQRICTIGLIDELDPTQQRCVSDALDGRGGATEGEERVIAFSPIEPVNWALVTEEPLQAVVGEGFNALLIAPLILVPVLLIALGAIWFGERQIVQPLQQLEQKAIALGQGQFEGIETDVGGIDAVKRLQSEFVAMANKVQTAQQNLRSQVGAITLGQEEERRRLARELHDDTIQALIALNQRVQLAQMKHNGVVSADLETMQQMVSEMIGDIRRFTQALRPVGLEELGLVPALELLIENSEQQAGIPILFTQTGRSRRLSLNAEFALYRIVQEALNNIAKHAGATEAHVSLGFNQQTTTVTIRDNGRGFTVPTSIAEMALAGNYGLIGIYERAQLISAEVTIIATPDTGTTITILLT